MSRDRMSGFRPGAPEIHKSSNSNAMGVVVSSTRVIVTPVMMPMVHPLSKRDVQRILSVLPADSTDGLRSVSLLGDALTAGGSSILVSYRRQGFIRLHAVSSMPRRVANLQSTQVGDLLRYGAHVDAGPEECVIHWTSEALRLFYTVGVLLPGVARHRREQEGDTEAGSIVRSLEDDDSTWIVSDIALEQWRVFLRKNA